MFDKEEERGLTAVCDVAAADSKQQQSSDPLRAE